MSLFRLTVTTALVFALSAVSALALGEGSVVPLPQNAATDPPARSATENRVADTTHRGRADAGDATVPTFPTSTGPSIDSLQPFEAAGWQWRPIVEPDGVRYLYQFGIFPGGRLYTYDGGDYHGLRSPASDPVEQLFTSSDGFTWRSERLDLAGYWTAGYPYRDALVVYGNVLGRNDWDLQWSTDGGPLTAVSTPTVDGMDNLYKPVVDDTIQINDTVVAHVAKCFVESPGDCLTTPRLGVSTDGGSSFTFVDQPGLTDIWGRHNRGNLFVHEESFRILAWEPVDASRQRSPTVWESRDGKQWRRLGTAEGLPFLYTGSVPSHCRDECVRSAAEATITSLPGGGLLFHAPVYSDRSLARSDNPWIGPGFFALSTDGESWIRTLSVPHTASPAGTVAEDGYPIRSHEPQVIGSWVVLTNALSFDKYITNDFVSWFSVDENARGFAGGFVKGRTWAVPPELRRPLFPFGGM